jgi:SAM-dependent methyltransferase
MKEEKHRHPRLRSPGLHQETSTPNRRIDGYCSPSSLTSILRDVKDRHDEDWEELARREPYFDVLTDEGLPGVKGNSVATAAFLDTGEEDISSLLSAITSLLGHEIAMRSALDFGCGVGRLTLPLARRAASVVACDIAPTMLAHARQNTESAGLRNVAFLDSELLEDLPRDHFDFVCSLLVFQYIRPGVGYQLVRTLLNLLAPDGVAALHLTFGPPGRSLRRLARWTGGRSRFSHEAVGVGRREDLPRPYTQINEYEERVVRQCINTTGSRVVGRFATQTGNTTGAVLVIQRLPAPVR